VVNPPAGVRTGPAADRNTRRGAAGTARRAGRPPAGSRETRARFAASPPSGIRTGHRRETDGHRACLQVRPRAASTTPDRGITEASRRLSAPTARAVRTQPRDAVRRPQPDGHGPTDTARRTRPDGHGPTDTTLWHPAPTDTAVRARPDGHDPVAPSSDGHGRAASQVRRTRAEPGRTTGKDSTGRQRHVPLLPVSRPHQPHPAGTGTLPHAPAPVHVRVAAVAGKHEHLHVPGEPSARRRVSHSPDRQPGWPVWMRNRGSRPWFHVNPPASSRRQRRLVPSRTSFPSIGVSGPHATWRARVVRFARSCGAVSGGTTRQRASTKPATPAPAPAPVAVAVAVQRDRRARRAALVSRETKQARDPAQLWRHLVGRSRPSTTAGSSASGRL
jgi:hypothetical protein